jgi:hypothetical protein
MKEPSMKRTIVSGLASLGFLLYAACATAVPIVYSFYGAGSGQLGGLAFSEAQIRLDFKTDTATTVTVIENGATVYRNDQGQAVFVLSQGPMTQVAQIAPNQIFVRYDPVNRLLTFGSYANSLFYPISLAWCAPQPQCVSMPLLIGDIGSVVYALGDIATNPSDSVLYPPAVAALATDLSGPALLTGLVTACAVPLAYSGGWNCPSTAPTAIQTDQGDLYFQESRVGMGIFTATLR